MKTKIIFAALALTLAGGIAAASIPKALASTPAQNTLVSEFAAKFGLKEAEVQAVFDSHRQQRQAQMQAQWEEKLTQAVTEGKITADQKQALLAKHQEMRQLRETQAKDWAAWLQKNGLENTDLGLGMGRGPGMKMGMGMHGW